MPEPETSGAPRPALVVAGGALALIAPALLRGRGLLATAELWRVPPWSTALLRSRGNGLLSDQLLAFLPWREFLRGELLAGRFPAWNPYILGGVPFAGCVQAAPFFPTSWLLAPLPAASYSWAAAFSKLFAAGLFTALHARRLGASERGAAVAGVSFSLCGFMVAWLGHPQTNVACLLPALFWALGRLAEAPTPRRAAALGLLGGLALLGGHPPTIAHVGLAAAAWALLLAARLDGARRRAFGLLGAGALLAAAALAAPAWLPYVEYYRLSSTPAASAALARWSTRLPGWAALHLALPLASGSPALGAEVLAAALGVPPEANFIERAAWLGLLPLSFAALGAWRRRREPEALFHAGLAAFGLAAAFGLWPLPALWRALPALSSINPTRLLLIWCFGVSTLAGLGAEEEAGRGFVAALGAALLAALMLYGLALLPLRAELLPEEKRFAALVGALALAEGGCALLVLRAPGGRAWAAPATALFALIPGWGVNPAAPRGAVFPETPAIAALRAEAGSARVFGLGWALAPDLGMPFELRDARGRDFATPRRYEELVTGASGDFGFYGGSATPPPNPALLGVGVLAASSRGAAGAPASWRRVYDGDLQLFRAPYEPRRALFVPSARAVADGGALVAARDPRFDPSRELWLDDGPAPAPPPRLSRGRARVLREGTDELELEAESDGPGWLLLLDNWFPGWQATVDGARVTVRRADHAFRAVAVPGGRSRVVFRYRPWSLRLGLLLAFASLAALAAASFTRFGSVL